MKEKKRSDAAVLLEYAGSYRGLTFLGLALSAAAMLLGMAPYICIWLAARDLIAAAPNWTQATAVAGYGWLAFGFAVAGIAVYFAALMCTHLAAFRTAANIRKTGMAHLMQTPLGFFDANASGLIRNRLDGAAAETETLLAHNLADIVGSATMVIAMIVLMFVFDWRMGAACLLAAVISILAMFTMMGGKNARLMAEYQAAQDVMSKAGTEYVRGIPVVKVFQQTVYSFKAFKDAIEDYSAKAERYTGDICRLPQSVNLTCTEGAFIFLVPVALLLAPRALQAGDFAGFVTDFAFYAVFSAIISTALARIMFAASGMMLAGGEQQRVALARALLKNAPIVLLDEATASLDVENETRVQGALSRLLAGKTVLVIAHRMRTVEAADKIVVLAEGRVAEEGRPADLIADSNSVFRRMTELQTASAGWSI
ncbi:MAG: ABC transporter ATP-binding protein/permease [Firmicutes bacterium]|nr:ABC transporter ATP-binding protein/permease [Bacillota bacterium]